jgi:catechol 2,3-dioxygenase-like lactoylglutathione lyase family enzyme
MNVSLGNQSKMMANPNEQNRIRKFYKEILGCVLIKESKETDLIRLGNDFFIGIIYDNSTLTESDLQKSIWLELRTNNPESLKKSIIDFGIKGIDFWDKDHFYFQAPGGQVFRIISDTEDMSKWQGNK